MIEALLLRGDLSNSADSFRQDGRSAVAKMTPNIGQHGRDFSICQALERGHGNQALVCLAIDFNGAEQAVEGEGNQAVRIASNPLRILKGRELGCG